MSAATESQRPDETSNERTKRLATEARKSFERGFVWNNYDVADVMFLAERLTALERERDELRKAANEAIGWLTAMLERREYDADHELRDLQDMLARAALTSSRETTDGK